MPLASLVRIEIDTSSIEILNHASVGLHDSRYEWTSLSTQRTIRRNSSHRTLLKVQIVAELLFVAILP